MVYFPEKSKKGFTLLELLISVGLLGFFTALLIIIINPFRAFQKTRDIVRFNDLQTLFSSISIIKKLNPDQFLGTSSIIYMSLMQKTSATCSDYQLPIITSTYSYNCVSQPTLIDGNGWIPINFEANPVFGIRELPTDPLNSGPYYYAYRATGSLFKLTTRFENFKNMQVSYYDGGIDHFSYEIGNDISMIVPENGLVMRYSLEEGTGTKAFDVSGFNHNANLFNFNFSSSSGWSSGKLGKALIFDGVDDYLLTDYAYQTNQLSSLTLCLWFNTTSTNAGFLISFSTSSYYGLELTSAGEINFYTRGADGSIDVLKGGSGLNNGLWHFVCADYSKEKILKNIYVDGSLIKVARPHNGNSLGDNTFKQGLIGDKFKGKIDEIIIFHKNFTPDEINFLYYLQK